MGTSVNQRSPDTDNWKVAQEIYTDPGLSTRDALKVLWRAASNPNEPNLYSLLVRPEIAGLMDVLDRHSEPAAATSEIRTYLSAAKVSSLATDIAARAISQSVGKESARSLYVERLFAEATSYLVSRDLPGYVGSSDKIPSLAAARSFLSEMTALAAGAAHRTDRPQELNRQNWASFVRRVVTVIREAS